MNSSLKRFMFLAYALHLMETDVVIEEAGLTIEQFEVIDRLLEAFLEKYDPEDFKEELIELVKELSKDGTE